MSIYAILGICGGGFVLFIFLFIIIVRKSNTERFNKRFKKSFQKVEDVKDELIYDKPVETKKTSAPIIENYVEEEPDEVEPLDNNEEELPQDDERFAKAMKRLEEIAKRNRERKERIEKEREEIVSDDEKNVTEKKTDDFDEFMNEHSYGRLFADKTLFEQIRDLSPELKAILFSGIFRPYDEGK